MQKLTTVLAAAVLSGALSCAAFAQNVAVVNNRPIKKATEDAWVKQLTAQGQKDSPELRQRIKEELIRREVLMQEAERRGVAQKDEVKFQLENQRQSLLIQALMHDELSQKKPLTDEEIKAEYEKQKAAAPAREFKARHILVKTEQEAKDILADLKKGKKFEELAKLSTDPGSGQNGGDLGWSAPDAYVKPFADALVKLEKGKTTTEPVKTEFGYHVIRLDDIRDTEFPDLDQVKGQLVEMMQQKRIQTFVKELQDKAKIR